MRIDQKQQEDIQRHWGWVKAMLYVLTAWCLTLTAIMIILLHKY